MEIGQVKNKSKRGFLPKRDRPDKGRDLGIFLKKQGRNLVMKLERWDSARP